MNRRTWLTAMMALPLVRWFTPKRVTRGGFALVSVKGGDAISVKDDCTMPRPTSYKKGDDASNSSTVTISLMYTPPCGEN